MATQHNHIDGLRPKSLRPLMLTDEREGERGEDDRNTDLPKPRPTAENDGTFDELSDDDELGDSDDLGVAPPSKEDPEVNEDGSPTREH